MARQISPNVAVLSKSGGDVQHLSRAVGWSLNLRDLGDSPYHGWPLLLLRLWIRMFSGKTFIAFRLLLISVHFLLHTGSIFLVFAWLITMVGWTNADSSDSLLQFPVGCWTSRFYCIHISRFLIYIYFIIYVDFYFFLSKNCLDHDMFPPLRCQRPACPSAAPAALQPCWRMGAWWSSAGAAPLRRRVFVAGDGVTQSVMPWTPWQSPWLWWFTIGKP